MEKNQRAAVYFGLLGATFMLGSLLLKDLFEYAPTVGWLGGFVSFLAASYFAAKMNKNKRHAKAQHQK